MLVAEYGGNVRKVLETSLPPGVKFVDNTIVQEIQHDHWCDLLASRGVCNCTPDVVLVEGAVPYFDSVVDSPQPDASDTSK